MGGDGPNGRLGGGGARECGAGPNRGRGLGAGVGRRQRSLETLASLARYS